MIAFIDAQRAGLLHPRFFLQNLIAGIIVGVVALPLAMAFAIASGMRPEQGIYTAIIAGLVVSICGGSRVQIAGPTGAFIVVLAGIHAEHGAAGLQLATLMAGSMLVLLGLAKLGSIIKFIPDPVIVGFTAGIAVIIFIGQCPDFLGLPAMQGEHLHQKLASLSGSLSQIHLPTTALASLSLVLLILLPKVPYLRKIPAPLWVLIIATLIQQGFAFDGVETLGSAFGGIPQQWPQWQVPDWSLAQMMKLIGPAFTIAMLGAIESLLSAVVADGMTGQRHHSNQELIGQGFANILTPFFGGFAATGAIARTATNVRNGGNSPLAGIIHALTLLVILLYLAPLASAIPLASLAAILFVVAWNMSERKHFIKMLRRAPRADVIILLITFLLTIFADLVVAVNVGVILAMLHFLRRMASSVHTEINSSQTLAEELGQADFSLPDDVLIFAVEGPFFFAAVENFERALAQIHADPRILIIRLKWVPFIDMTGLQTLEEAIVALQDRGVQVFLSGANSRVTRKMRRAGILKLIGEEQNFPQFSQALAASRLM